MSVRSKINVLKLKREAIHKNDINYKAVYQEYDWCYEHFINQGMSHQEMADLVGCKKRTIEKWCTEVHKLDIYQRMKDKTLNKLQNDLIIGSLLGDGHIDKREDYPLFIVSHAENQKEYLYYKYNIMKNLCRMTPTKYDARVKKFSEDREYMCQNWYRFNTGTYNVLDKYRKYSKLELVNQLNEYSFSIWLLDDGYFDPKKCLWELCSAMMNEQENIKTLNILHNKFEISGHIEHDKRYILFDVPSSRKINNIILHNIPNDLDVVKYKTLIKDVS